MIRRVGFFGVLFILSVVLQSTLLHFLRIGGVKPDLLLVIVVLSAVLKGKRTGAAVGFAYGFLEDLIIGKYIGSQALTKMVTGYIIGHLERKVFPDNIFIPVVVGFAGTLLHHFLFMITLVFLGSFDIYTLKNYLSLTLAAGLYNMCVAILIYGRMYYSSTQGILKM